MIGSCNTSGSEETDINRNAFFIEVSEYFNDRGFIIDLIHNNMKRRSLISEDLKHSKRDLERFKAC